MPCGYLPVRATRVAVSAGAALLLQVEDRLGELWHRPRLGDGVRFWLGRRGLVLTGFSHVYEASAAAAASPTVSSASAPSASDRNSMS